MLSIVTAVMSLTAFFLQGAADPDMIHSRVRRDSPSMITQFSPDVYGNFCQGVTKPGLRDPHMLAGVKWIAQHITPAGASKLPVWHKELYDYVHCLTQLEATGLVRKPFKTWTVADIQQVNAWLTRLQVSHPGRFRTVDTAWPVRQLNDVEQLEQARIVEKAKTQELTDSEVAFLQENNHFFPAGAAVPYLVQSLLTDTSEALQNLESDRFSQTIHDELNIAGYAHHQIVAIHPWHEANKRTGRVLSAVVLMQRGIKPPVFPESKKYIDVFFAGLKNNSCTKLSAYTRDLVVAEQEARLQLK